MNFNPYIKYFLIFFASACWGIHPSLSKEAMAILHNSYLIVLLQNIIIFCGIMAYQLIKPLPDLFNQKHIKPAIAGAILNYAIAIPVMIMTTKHMLIAHMLLFIGLAPLFTYLMALLWKQTTLSSQRLLGSLFTFIALGILFVHEIFTKTHLSKWYLIILLTPLSFGIINNVIKSWSKFNLHVIGLVLYQNIFSSIFIAFILFLTHSDLTSLQQANVNLAGLMVVLALLHLSGQLFFYKLLQIANIVFSSQAGNLSILIGVAWAIFIGHEVVSITFFVAMFTMLYGVYLTQK